MGEQNTVPMKIIAKIHSDFRTKFGIPRQSGLVDELEAEIIFEPPYRNTDAVRGLEGFSHIWLLWEFSECVRDDWSPTVRPPRLGNNQRMGVFATRSPYRPNPIGLSSVRLESIEYTEQYGAVLHVRGADLMDGTPIFDIKPYLPYADSHNDAECGFASQYVGKKLSVLFPDELLEIIPEEKRDAVKGVLAEDPRPSYVKFSDKIYGVEFGDFDVRFRVENDVITVCDVERLK